MKRYITLLLLALYGLGLSAQTVGDAVNFSDEYNYGSARTMGMGGAFTALGGDPASIAINPAGGAVAGYSTVTLTPGFNIAVTNPGGRRFKFDMPNMSAIFNFDLQRTGPLKRVSLGITSNTTNLYTGDISYSGEHSATSLSSYMAWWAEGIRVDEFRAEDVYDRGNVPWPLLAGWKSAMFDPKDNIGSCSSYLGVNQDLYAYMKNPVKETFNRTSNGSKRDIHISISADVADFLYVGATFGVASLKFARADEMTEKPVSSLLSAQYLDLRYNANDGITASGVFGQFGVIAVPVPWLRFGVSYKTPTKYDFRETMQYSGATNRRYVDGGGVPYAQRESFTTKTGVDRYNFIAPGLWNFGAAGVIAKCLVLSVDYSLRDYRNARYTTTVGNRTAFSELNTAIKEELGLQHTIRAGLEARAGNFMSARLGYNYIFGTNAMDYCAGIGFDSHSFFFADLAFCLHRMKSETVKLYGDYYGYTTEADAMSGDLSKLRPLDAPRVDVRSDMYTIALTLGFRF